MSELPDDIPTMQLELLGRPIDGHVGDPDTGRTTLPRLVRFFLQTIGGKRRILQQNLVHDGLGILGEWLCLLLYRSALAMT